MKMCYIGTVPKWTQARGPLPSDSEGSYRGGFFAAIFEGRRTKQYGKTEEGARNAASVALLVRMISRNERAVSEATSWLKRIVVTWVVLNTLGFAVAYLQPLIQGGNYTP